MKRNVFYYQILTKDNDHAGYISSPKKIDDDMSLPIKKAYFKRVSKKEIIDHIHLLESDLENAKLVINQTIHKSTFSAVNIHKRKGTNKSTGGFF